MRIIVKRSKWCTVFIRVLIGDYFLENKWYFCSVYRRKMIRRNFFNIFFFELEEGLWQFNGNKIAQKYFISTETCSRWRPNTALLFEGLVWLSWWLPKSVIVQTIYSDLFFGTFISMDDGKRKTRPCVRNGFRWMFFYKHWLLFISHKQIVCPWILHCIT